MQLVLVAETTEEGVHRKKLLEVVDLSRLEDGNMLWSSGSALPQDACFIVMMAV